MRMERNDRDYGDDRDKKMSSAIDEAVKAVKDALFDEQCRKLMAYREQFAHLSEVLHEKNMLIGKLRKVIAEKDEVIDEIANELELKHRKLESIRRVFVDENIC